MKMARSMSYLALALTPIAFGTAQARPGPASGEIKAKDDHAGHASWNTMRWVGKAGGKGKHAIFFQSRDGRLVGRASQGGGGSIAGTFDNIGYVVSGTARLAIKNGPTLNLKQGDVYYVAEGASGQMTASGDFKDIAFLSAGHRMNLSNMKPAAKAARQEAACPAEKLSPDGAIAALGNPKQGIRAWSAPLDTLTYKPMLGSSNQASMLFRSASGKRMSLAFKATGSFHETPQVDEIGYVLAGTSHIAVKDGPTYDLKAGDIFYWRPGAIADLTLSPDYQEMVMISGQCLLNW